MSRTSNLHAVRIVVPHPLDVFTVAMPPTGRIEAAERAERAAAGLCWSRGRGACDAVSKALCTLGFSSGMRQPNSRLNPVGCCDSVIFQPCLWLCGQAKLSEVLHESHDHFGLYCSPSKRNVTYDLLSARAKMN